MSEAGAIDVVWLTLARGAQAAVPLMLAANGELISERAGVLNLGVEGTMLAGAFAGAAAAWWSGSAAVGVAAAALTGALVGLLFATWTVFARRDQIVSGLAINLVALGLTGVAVQRIDRWCEAHGTAFVPPGLWVTGRADYVLIAAFVIVAATHVLLYRARPGLTLRAVGENPEAADAAGVRVVVVRAAAVIAGSTLAGLGGAYLSLGLTTRFQEGMTQGRGFLALALVIFGRWSPIGVAAAALFFGCVDALQIVLQPSLGRQVHLLYPALVALPYVMTLVALAGMAGRARPPAGLGVPYERG